MVSVKKKTGLIKSVVFAFVVKLTPLGERF